VLVELYQKCIENDMRQLLLYHLVRLHAVRLHAERSSVVHLLQVCFVSRYTQQLVTALKEEMYTLRSDRDNWKQQAQGSGIKVSCTLYSRITQVTGELSLKLTLLTVCMCLSQDCRMAQLPLYCA
jgi:hypothetical protein